MPDRYDYLPERDRYGRRMPQTLDEALIDAARRQSEFAGRAGDRTLHLAGSGERAAASNLRSLLIAKQGWAGRPRGRAGYGGGGIDEETSRKLAGLGRARLPETGQQRAGFDPATMGGVATRLRAEEATELARTGELQEALAGRTSREEVARITAGGRTQAELVRGQQARETATFKGDLAIQAEGRARENPLYILQKKKTMKETEKLILELSRYGYKEAAENLRSFMSDIADLDIAKMRTAPQGEDTRIPVENYLKRLLMMLEQNR